MADDSTLGPAESVLDSPLVPEGETAGSEGQAVARQGRHGVGLIALAIMGVHLLARFGGLIQKVVLAYFFGTKAVGDAAAVLERIFSIVYYIPEELLTHSLLPVFNKLRKGEVEGEAGEQAAWRLASLTGTLQAIILVLVTVIIMANTDWLLGVMLKRPNPADPAAVAKFGMAVRLVRVAMLGLFCTSMGSLTYVILNAYKRFVSPAMGDVAQKLGVVIGTVVVCLGFGRENPMGYAIGFILGGVFKLLTHLVALGPNLRRVRLGFDFKNPALRELGVLMLPLLAGSLVSKGRDILEMKIAWIAANAVEGTVASLDFARKIVWTPITVIPYALGIALFPFLADWARNNDRVQVTKAFVGASRMMVFVFLPLTIACLLLGPEIITSLYKGGKFDQASVVLTTRAFQVYGAGLVFYALEIIALQVFYAHRDTRTPFWIGLVASILQLSTAYVMGVQQGFGNAGIALGFTISKTLKVVAMWYFLKPRLAGYEWPALLSVLGKCLVASVGMAAWLVLAKLAVHHTHVLNLTHKLHAIVFLGGATLVGALIFVGVAAALHVPELDVLLGRVKRKLRRG